MFLGIINNGFHRITICSPDVPSHVKVFWPIEVVLEVIPNGLGTRRVTVNKSWSHFEGAYLVFLA